VQRSVDLPSQAVGQRKAWGGLPDVLDEEGVVVDRRGDLAAAGSEDRIHSSRLQTSVAVLLDKKVIAVRVGSWVEMSEIYPEFKLVCPDRKREVVEEVELLLDVHIQRTASDPGISVDRERRDKYELAGFAAVTRRVHRGLGRRYGPVEAIQDGGLAGGVSAPVRPEIIHHA
jgi:hypothetical protein